MRSILERKGSLVGSLIWPWVVYGQSLTFLGCSAMSKILICRFLVIPQVLITIFPSRVQHKCLGHFLHSRIPPVENGPSRLDIFPTGFFLSFFLSSVVSRVDSIVFVLFLKAVGVREYCCMAVENRLAALCLARSPRATRASRATNFRPSGLVPMGLAKNRQSYVRGVALSREPPKLQQA